MILTLMQRWKGRQTTDSSPRRARRFQPNLGLAIEGLELRLAPSGMDLGVDSGPAEQQDPTGGDSTNVTVTNQDDGGAPTSTSSDDNRTSLGD